MCMRHTKGALLMRDGNLGEIKQPWAGDGHPHRLWGRG